MPGYDGKGPEGKGPVGRGLGPCGGRNQQETNTRLGLRRGRGRGPRGFWRHGEFSSDKNALTHKKAWLERELNAVNTQLENLGDETVTE
jgi:dsRNA-specific ribonuclease